MFCVVCITICNVAYVSMFYVISLCSNFWRTGSYIVLGRYKSSVEFRACVKLYRALGGYDGFANGLDKFANGLEVFANGLLGSYICGRTSLFANGLGRLWF